VGDAGGFKSRQPHQEIIVPGLGMARKKKVKRFRAVTAVKELARERVGMPPPTQIVPDRKKRKKEKHKATLGKILGDA
jgi:hypothetical protein